MKATVTFVLTDGTAVHQTASSLKDLESIFEKIAGKLRTLGLNLDTCNDMFDGKVQSFNVSYEA